MVIRKKGNWLPSDQEIENAWESNPHGFGIGYAHKGKLYVGKTMEIKKAKAYIANVPKGAPAILHWRFATHGAHGEANCHPFSCLNNRWIGAHNGILHKQPLIAGLTDSESYLRGLSGKPSKTSIERDIDRLGYGKIGLLSVDGQIIIANEVEGDWRVKGEVWESNSGLDGWGSGLPTWSDSKPWWHGGSRSRMVKLTCCMCGDWPEFAGGHDHYCGQCAEEVEREALT